MAVQSEHSKTLVAAEAIAAYARVHVNSSGQFALSGAGVNHTGVAVNAAASGASCGAVLRTPGSTFKMIASGAVSAGAAVYSDASGKITATKKGGKLGVAINAATADGDIIEVTDEGKDLELFEDNYVADSTDATNNYVNIDPGFGSNPAGRILAWVRSSAGATNAITAITFPGSGVVRIACTDVVLADIVSLSARRTDS